MRRFDCGVSLRHAETVCGDRVQEGWQEEIARRPQEATIGDEGHGGGGGDAELVEGGNSEFAKRCTCCGEYDRRRAVA